MLWFDGPVRNAIEKVKSTGVKLLVFVKGDDGLSRKYEKLLNEEKKFTPKDCIAIKISHDSAALKWFKQIYITVPIPSVFVIRNNGLPVSVVSSGQTSDVVDAISDALQKHKNDLEEKGGEEEIAKESSRQVHVNINKTDKEKVSGTKSLEIVRNVGVSRARASEEEIRQRLIEIRSFPSFLLIDNCSPSPDSPPSPPPPPLPTSKVQSARIQFRLPNNEMPSWEFPDLSTLADVRAYLMEKKKLTNFKLLRTYPRTVFNTQDENKTLVELCLTPSATLIVVLLQDESVQARMKNILVRPNLFSTLVDTLLQPLFTFLKYFKKHILRIPEETESRPKRLRSDTAVEKRTNKKTSTSKIRGFKFEDDPDTENTDNGNSTQQRFPK